jgi:DNA-binding NtrC family response regulator
MEPIGTVVAIVRDAASLEAIHSALAALDIPVLSAGDADEGWDLVDGSHAGVILVEASLAEGTGLLERIADRDPDARVLLLTDRYTADSAVEGIRQGACDCLSKPLTPASLQQRVAEVLEETRLRRETLELDERLLESFSFHGMAGRSPQMLETFARIRRVAPHYRIAMISGATGTGKELVAHALHELSPVSARRFAVCNCSAIVETLFESELFGHVKGAFTGAAQDRTGLFEYAQGGTVFLDEIADMPLSTQSKLLRVVQNQELQRVGSPEVRKVDVRVIAATNSNLMELVAEHKFREDLYYRLAVFPIHLPALRDRMGDLDELAAAFVTRYDPKLSLSHEALRALARHPWQGNVRELRNAIERATIFAGSGREIRAEHIVF